MPRKKTSTEPLTEPAVSAESGAMDAAEDTAGFLPAEGTDSFPAEDMNGDAGTGPPDMTGFHEAEDSGPTQGDSGTTNLDDGPGLNSMAEAEDAGGTTDQDELLRDWMNSSPPTEEDSAPLLRLDTAPNEESAVSTVSEGASITAPPRHSPSRPAAVRGISEQDRILTIDARSEVQTEEDQRAAIWHEIQNADWTRRILTGKVVAVERTPLGHTVAVVDYKGFRVVIPIKEMLLYPEPYPTGPEYTELMDRLGRILMTRVHTVIDFVISGHDNKARSAVGSRKEAMYRKRQTFYLNKSERDGPLIYEGRIVQARVVSVAEKMIRVEVFGIECPIVARGLSRSWIGDAREKYHLGDTISVRIQKITGDTVQNLAVAVDVRSVFQEEDSLRECVKGGRYAGRVTDIRGGMAYIHLANGANAIAHSCYDRRTPGKGDDVSFSVTRLDEERGVAVGSITRIIRQNL